ncbi:MAG: hypothetical protein EOL87_12720 [Spartobacteria bacterium]|nr:hypothetical protein [Spartobacteria bacterium]
MKKATLAVRIGGTLSENARLHFAIKEGANLLVEKEVAVENGYWQTTNIVDTEGGQGDVYLLLRVAGTNDWSCEITRMLWSPYDSSMLKDAHLTLDDVLDRGQQ